MADDAPSYRPRPGSSARSPLGIPPRGWMEAILRIASQFGADSIVLIAGGVSFFAILSAAPAMTAMISVYGFFNDPAGASEHARLLYGVLPGEAYLLFERQLVRVADTRNSALAIGFFVSLAIALWMSNSGMRQFCIALTRVNKETIDRPLPLQFAISIALTVGAIVAFLLAAGVVGAAPLWLRAVWLGPLEPAIAIGRWAALFAIASLYAMVIYHYGPDRRRPRWRWVWPGAVIGSALWVLMSIAFSFCVGKFTDFQSLYGSLAGVIVIMLWTFLSTVIYLLGAELNAELERQTAEDSTIGADLPIGRRNAVPADEIGPHPDIKKLRRMALDLVRRD